MVFIFLQTIGSVESSCFCLFYKWSNGFVRVCIFNSASYQKNGKVNSADYYTCKKAMFTSYWTENIPLSIKSLDSLYKIIEKYIQ